MRDNLTLTSTELAVLLETLDGPPLDAAALADLNTTAQEIALARQALRRSGVLAALESSSSAVAADVVAFLAPALAPERVFILRAERRDQTARQVVYSRRAEHWVRNDVTAEGQHRFLALTSTIAVVEDVLQETGIALSSGAAMRAEVQSLAAVLRRASGLNTLVSGPLQGTTAASASALSWITGGDDLWWVNPAGPRETAQRCSVAELKSNLLTLLDAGAP